MLTPSSRAASSAVNGPRADRAALASGEHEIGWLTIPEPPLPTMPALNPSAEQISDTVASL
ncbi:hypothetical protein BH11MYX2_BH11MYX2_37020 [soil metagenome]